MRCAGCGTENPPRARFCLECATPFARRCAHCGTDLPEAAKFCMECARPVAGDDLPATPVAPRAYTPRHLAKKILANRSALEGERKQVTILFADVVGSTELIRGRDPEEAQALLDGVTRLMMDAVHRYEGTVSRLMGDGLMAMFGAPVAHEDHAVRACYAALAMQEAIRAYADEARTRYGVQAEARVGLCSGEVVVRTISDDLHMDYTAMGETVHLASRMEGLARAGTSVLAASTLALVEGYVRVRSLGAVPVKGLDGPVEVYELRGGGLARTRLQAAAVRGLSRFVGRDAEMSALHAALERAAGGRGQVAALVGEPGVGKSRLVWELTRSHRTEGWLVLESGSVSYGKATSYLPVIDLLKAYCRIETRDDPRTVREKLAGKLLMLDRALEGALPALLALLDVPVDDPAWDALDPGQRRRATLDAVKRVLLRESQEQPLLLVFEDLHWIDSESQALLDSLVESLPGARIFLLVNYRPEYSHTWGSRTAYTQVRIDALAEEGAEALLASLLGEDPSLGVLKRRLLERTEGNPLFLEESVRSLVEIGALVGERGAYRLTGSVAETQVPATIQAVLAARIDRLPAEEKRLLQIAAAIGKDVPDALLCAVAGRSDDEVRHVLAGLQAAELLYEASLFPELEYTFKHALTHVVAYGSLLHERRRALHTRIVAAIEQLYADRLVEHVEQLADHAYRGEVWDRAVEYSRQAGEKADARAAHAEATTAYERALDALSKLPASPERTVREIDLRIAVRTPLWQVMETDRVLEHLRAAERLAEEAGEYGRQGRALGLLIQTFGRLGQNGDALETSKRAIPIARKHGDLRARLMTYVMAGQLSLIIGDFDGAIGLEHEALALMEGQPPGERYGMAAPMAVNAMNVLSRALAETGRFDEAFAVADRMVKIGEADNGAYALVMIYNVRGSISLLHGDVQESLPILSRSIAVRQATNLPDFPMNASISLARGLLLLGRVDESAVLHEQSVNLEKYLVDGRYVPVIQTWWAAILDRLGRRQEAETAVTTGLDLARVSGQRPDEAYALWVGGQIADDAVVAERRYGEALVLAEKLGMRPLQAHCHLGLGKLYRRIGRAEAARTELITAVSMLREMGMTFWLPEAETELAHLTG
jgi:class 3 adenylate cyclase/tetratricopeptide (TPR) repeat protein